LLHKIPANGITHRFYLNCYKVWISNGIEYKPGSINEIKNEWIYNNVLLRNKSNETFSIPGSYNSVYRQQIIPQFFKNLPITVPIGNVRVNLRKFILDINKAYFNITLSGKTKTCFYIKNNENKWVNISDTYFKSKYYLILANKNYIKIWESKWKIWESKWNIHLQKTITQLEWKNIWCAVNHRISNYYNLGFGK